MNGHLGVKSGPLAPTSCKLTKQMLVLQQMTAHYKKLQNVKSSIDMSAPKTLSTSVKSRDRMRRQHPAGKNPLSRPTSSRPSSRPSSRASNSGDHFSSNQAYADDPLVDQIVREALQDDLRLQLDSARGPRSPYAPKKSSGGRRALYDSARSSNDHAANENQQRGKEEVVVEGGDVLDIHKDRFTEARPFQPRVLRKNVPSKLSQFRYYNKPKPTSSAAPTAQDTEAAVLFHRRPEDENSAALFHRRPEEDRGAVPENADPGHVRWLMQQAESARLRQDIGQGGKNASFEPDSGTLYDRTHTRDGTDGNTSQRVQHEEEELRYLQFYSDVTDDVLNRGIFTNKVLNQVFQHHLERNRHGLRNSKMREILQNIRSELGIPEEDRLDDTFGFGSPELADPTSATRFDSHNFESSSSRRIDLHRKEMDHQPQSRSQVDLHRSEIDHQPQSRSQVDLHRSEMDHQSSLRSQVDLRKSGMDQQPQSRSQVDLHRSGMDQQPQSRSQVGLHRSETDQQPQSRSQVDLHKSGMDHQPQSRSQVDLHKSGMDQQPQSRSQVDLHRSEMDHQSSLRAQIDPHSRGMAQSSYLNNTEVEESHLAICQTRPNLQDTYEVTDLSKESAPGAPVFQLNEVSMDVSPPRPLQRRKQPVAAEKSQEELLTTQDEADLELMQATLKSAIERSNSQESRDDTDVTDARGERDAYDEEHWTKKAGIEDSTYSLATEGGGASLSSTMQSDVGAPNFMTTTLRPGEFGTLMQSRPPLARTRMGKSVTFASRDEVLADADPDADAATLTEVSLASSSLEMGSLRRSLPSETSDPDHNAPSATTAASTDYDDDFEDDDAF